MSYIGNPIVSTDFPKDTFSGNGSTTAFTMSIAPASVNAVIVIVSGVTQDPSTYTISGTTLTFSGAPPTGTSNISVRHLGVAGIPNVPALASVGVSQLSATGTPSSTTYLRGDNTWATVSGGTLIPSGTAMLFAQTAAPTGFTKSTTHDNKALRVVSGTAGSGGSVAFTTAFASQTPAGTVSVSVGAGTLAVGIGTLSAAATTLSTAQMPSHNHTATVYGPSVGFAGNPEFGAGNSGFGVSNTGTTNSNGSGSSHSHSMSGSPSLSGAPSVTSASFSGTAINLAVQYVDVIIATKD